MRCNGWFILFISSFQREYLQSKTINSSTSTIINSIYFNFSSTCRHYTDVMAYKHELLTFVFDDFSFNITAVINNIIQIVIQLENAAAKLQSMAVCLLLVCIYHVPNLL